MNTYKYADGYSHRSEDLLTVEQIKRDEKEHGLLLLMAKPNGQRIRCFYDERGGKPKAWENKS